MPGTQFTFHKIRHDISLLLHGFPIEGPMPFEP
jgi:hypothetical protein